MKKKIFILGTIFGLLIGLTIGVYAAYKYQASDVGYTPSNTSWKVSDVQSAINDLYEKSQRPMELTLGSTYSMGGYEWVAVEEIDGGYVMQSTGMTAGTWPGYKLTGNYDGTKNYGNADTYYTGVIDGDNIANYNVATQNWYATYGSTEKVEVNYGSGLFIISPLKAGLVSNYSQGSGYYWLAHKTAATNCSAFGTSRGESWLGHPVGSLNSYVVRSDGVLQGGDYQSLDAVIAPAFNLDSSKVYLDGNEIKKK